MAIKTYTLEEAKSQMLRLVCKDITDTKMNMLLLLEDIFAGFDDTKFINYIKILEDGDVVKVKKENVSNRFMIEAYMTLGVAIEKESGCKLDEVIEQYWIHMKEGHEDD